MEIDKKFQEDWGAPEKRWTGKEVQDFIKGQLLNIISTINNLSENPSDSSKGGVNTVVLEATGNDAGDRMLDIKVEPNPAFDLSKFILGEQIVYIHLKLDKNIDITAPLSIFMKNIHFDAEDYETRFQDAEEPVLLFWANNTLYSCTDFNYYDSDGFFNDLWIVDTFPLSDFETELNDALTTANSALGTANSAMGVANSAMGVANSATTTAENAQNTANKANGTANSALEIANSAATAKDSLSTRITNIENKLTDYPLINTLKFKEKLSANLSNLDVTAAPLQFTQISSDTSFKIQQSADSCVGLECHIAVSGGDKTITFPTTYMTNVSEITVPSNGMVEINILSSFSAQKGTHEWLIRASEVKFFH